MKIHELQKGVMKQVLTLSDVFAVGYGDLGSSIYYALGITAIYALGATPIALAIAGFVFVCTALTYAEMASMSRASGGSATFAKHAFNDLISFIAGWALLLDFIVTIAISSYSVAPYLSYFFPSLQHVEVKIIFTICLIGALFVLNFFGSKHSTRLSWILTILTLATQLGIVAIGIIFLVEPQTFLQHLKIGGINKLWSPTWKEFWKGTAMAMVAYTGIESMAQLTSETKKPSKTVPRAILLAMGVLLTMYFLVSLVALSAVTPQDLGTKYLENPLAGIVAGLPFGQTFLAPWVGLLGAIILLVAANAGLMGASRLSFRLGEYYQLPRTFYKLHPTYKTPYVALIFFTVLSILIIIWSSGRLSFLADLYNFGAMLAFFFSHLSLIILRIKEPNKERPFKVPFNIRITKTIRIPLSAIVGALATFSVWVLVMITKPEGRYLGIVWIGVGLLCYILYRKKKKIAPAGQLEIEKVKMPNFQKVSFSNILVPTKGGRETEAVQIACQLAKYHGAKLTAMYVVEVPFSLSINTPLFHQVKEGEKSLFRAEAIAREFGVDLEVKLVKSRSIAKAILDLSEEQKFDLVVLGASFKADGLGKVVEQILADSPCRVFISHT